MVESLTSLQYTWFGSKLGTRKNLAQRHHSVSSSSHFYSRTRDYVPLSSLWYPSQCKEWLIQSVFCLISWTPAWLCASPWWGTSPCHTKKMALFLLVMSQLLTKWLWVWLQSLVRATVHIHGSCGCLSRKVHESWIGWCPPVEGLVLKPYELLYLRKKAQSSFSHSHNFRVSWTQASPKLSMFRRISHIPGLAI